MQTSAIFPLFYLPPTGYFSALNTLQFNLSFERHEHFPKQTFRNRASIASPDGILDLTVPVIKGSKVHTPFKDVKISYDLKWQRLHWLSLQNCYRSSAYFEFYEDGLVPFYEKKQEFLFDYNLELFKWICKQLKMDTPLNFTTDYQPKVQSDLDFRDKFGKKEIYSTETKPYFQVFSDRNPFLPNLSILDLLFNQGPQAKSFL
jgi:hypothetical protein